MPATTPKQKPFPEEDKANAKAKNGDYVRPVFIRCDLTAEQKREMAEWANNLNADNLLDYLTESVEEGYTVSLKVAEVGYQCSLTQSGAAQIGRKNVGKSLVTRASTPERAVWALYYKHTQVLEKDWGTGGQESQLEW